jgi:thiamine biosynthesis lipoprotein
MKSVFMESIQLRAILILVILSLLVPSCQKRSPCVVKRHRILMGTLVEISIVGRDEDKAAAAINDAFAEMERIENLMSKWIPESEVSKINRWAGVKPVKVSAEVLEVIQRAREISKASGGYFDISVGGLLDLWGFETSGGRVPAEVEVEQALQSVGYGAIVVDREASTVELRRGMCIDLGGIAKGYAVDRAFEVLRSKGYGNMIVNAGGDMRVGGRKTNGPWVIGIQDPRGGSRILARFDVGDISVATSGDYERYFEADGVRYHHLLNPFTGYPGRQCRSVTIKAKDAVTADALATAVFVMGPEEGLRLIEATEGVEALIVTADGEIIQSKKWGQVLFLDKNQETRPDPHFDPDFSP